MKIASKIIQFKMKEEGLKQIDVANRMGMDSRALSQKMTRQKDLKFEDFMMIVECMGYKIILQKAESGAYRVAPEVAVDIIREKAPEGKYWVHDGMKYMGIVVYEGEVKTEQFKDSILMHEWLSENGAKPAAVEKNQEKPRQTLYKYGSSGTVRS